MQSLWSEDMKLSEFNENKNPENRKMIKIIRWRTEMKMNNTQQNWKPGKPRIESEQQKMKMKNTKQNWKPGKPMNRINEEQKMKMHYT